MKYYTLSEIVAAPLRVAGSTLIIHTFSVALILCLTRFAPLAG